MLSLHRLALTDYVLYKEQEFEFLSGLTVVRGGNRSGKSLMFSPIRTLLFDEDSIPPGAKAVLTGTKDDIPFDITGWSEGKSTRYSLMLDGVDQRTDTIAKARSAIDKVIDLPTSLYSTTIGLTGLSDHPLISGKPSTRLEWLHATLAFAELYDAYAEKVEARLKDTKSKALEHGVLKKELARLVSEEPEDPGQVPDKATKFKERLQEKQKERDGLVKLLKLPSKPDRSMEDLEERLKRTEHEIEKLEEIKALWSQYKRDHERWQNQLDENTDLVAQLNKLAKKLNVPEKLLNKPSKLFDSTIKQLDKVKRKLSRVRRDNERYEEQSDYRKILADQFIELKFKTLEETKDALKSIDDKLAYYRVSLENAGDVCVFCGKDIAKLRSSAEEDIEKLTKRAKSLKKQVLYHEALLVELVVKEDEEPIRNKISQLEELLSVLKSLNKVGTVEEPSEPTKTFDKERFEHLTKRRSKLSHDIEAIKVYDRLMRDLPEELLSVKNPQRAYDKLSSEITELSEKLTKINDRLVEHRTKVALRKKWETDVSELTSRTEELKQFPKDLKILLLLKKAFGRDGLRADTLSTSMELFLTNINSLAGLMWNEPFKFELDVGPRKCNVIVHRNRRSGSIFSLSGSERRAWQLISGLALIRLLPSSSLCDTIILDELESNTDVSSRERFIYDFMPELMKSVPKVVIVTPMDKKEFPVPCDREFLAVKKNAQSQLIES